MDRMKRVAVVTGAARGIGAAVVRRLAWDDWAVVAIDIASGDATYGYPFATKEDLEETIASCPDQDAVLAVPVDASDHDALTGAVGQAVERFGGVDAAVAGAGLIAGGEPVWRMNDAHWDALFHVNVGAVRQLARVVVPAMLRHPPPRHGRFVAIASAAGHRGLPGLAAYCATKHACVGFVRGLAADLRGTGITANVVSPGSTETVMLGRTAELYDMEGTHGFAAQALLDRLLTPDEIAAAVEWLCSPDSSALTGSVVSADGGLTT
jgi:SDR family mycofactocin-dependent oxidoreductase